jgi:hypothetical protein
MIMNLKFQVEVLHGEGHRYLLMRLSRRWVPILVSGHRATPRPTEAYVVEYYIPGSWLVGGRIMIKYVRDLAI